jgi:hypothetical protein
MIGSGCQIYFLETFVLAVKEGFEAAKKFFTIEPEAIRISVGIEPPDNLNCRP